MFEATPFNTALLRSMVLCSVVAVPLATRADELTRLSATLTPLTKEEVTVVRVEKKSLVYRLASGAEKSEALDHVFLVKPSDDDAMGPAEEAYVTKQWNDAIDGYTKVLRTNVPWKTRYVVPRLLDAAARANRFDAALVGYIGLAKIDPGGAASMKPALPARGSKLLDDAVRDLNAGISSAGTDAERQALLSMLLDVQLARGDQTAAEAAVETLLKTTGGANPDPKLAGLVAEIRLGQARVALDAKRYADVAKAVDVASPRLTEPKQQAEALFLAAEAKLGLAKADDKATLLDAALAYMRVVAHFADAEGSPFVGQSLLRAGEALESAGSPAEARALYEQTAGELPDTPFAAEAKRRVARLSNTR